MIHANHSEVVIVADDDVGAEELHEVTRGGSVTMMTAFVERGTKDVLLGICSKGTKWVIGESTFEGVA